MFVIQMKNALTAAHDNSFRQSCNNHNQVCYTGFVAAALALYELEKYEARWWLEDALENNLKAQVFSYSPDGNHAEGAGYWNYGTSFECMTIAMLYKIFGTTGGLADVDGFDRTGLWVLYTDGADKWRSAFNFMDYMDGELSVRYALWWMAEYYHKPELLVDEMRRLLGDAFRTERVTPILPCWVNSLSFDPGILRNPETRVWSGAGIQPVLIVHTDWTFSRTDKYLGVKGGTSDAPHGHMDAGSFVYDAFGHRWAEDLGGQGYAALESALGRKGGNVWLYNQNSWRWKVFRLNNYGHGTLTLDGRLHNTNGKATILETYEDDSRLGGKLDMGSVLSNGLDVSASRSFELVGNALTVTDSIAIAPDGKSHEITWQIITGAKVRLRNNRIILRYGRDKMKITPKCGGEVSSVAVFSQPAKGPEEWDAPNPGRKITGFKIKTLPNAGPVTIKTLISPDEK
ncbi:MAG: heparinase II/III family protein [Bacteroidales bacterium]|nr:heparinase II/III family protein [Bacteroidales bacterium]